MINWSISLENIDFLSNLQTSRFIVQPRQQVFALCSWADSHLQNMSWFCRQISPKSSRFFWLQRVRIPRRESFERILEKGYLMDHWQSYPFSIQDDDKGKNLNVNFFPSKHLSGFAILDWFCLKNDPFQKKVSIWRCSFFSWLLTLVLLTSSGWSKELATSMYDAWTSTKIDVCSISNVDRERLLRLDRESFPPLFFFLFSVQEI